MPRKPLDPGEEPVMGCPCQPFPAVPVPGSVPAPGLGFSVRNPPWIPQSDRMLRIPCPVCGSLHPGSQLSPCRTAGQKWARSLSPTSKGFSSQAPQDHKENLWNSNSSALCALSTLPAATHLCATLIRNNNYNNNDPEPDVNTDTAQVRGWAPRQTTKHEDGQLSPPPGRAS